MYLSEREIRAIGQAFGLQAERSQIGPTVWGVRTPGESGTLLTHPIEIAQHISQVRKISLRQGTQLVQDVLRRIDENQDGFTVFGDYRVANSARFWEAQCALASSLAAGKLDDAKDYQWLIGKPNVEVQKLTEGGWSTLQFE